MTDYPQSPLFMASIHIEGSGWKRNDTMTGRYYVTSYKYIKVLKSPLNHTVLLFVAPYISVAIDFIGLHMLNYLISLSAFDYLDYYR